MLLYKLPTTFLVLLFAGNVMATDIQPLDALRAEYPRGIPWTVKVITLDGKDGGELQRRITSEHASSCTGEVGNGYRVEFVRSDRLMSPLPIASYGIAKFVDDKVKIDLTGGTCDGYLMMDGTMTLNGSSAGGIYTFGPGGAHDLGTYHASISP